MTHGTAHYHRAYNKSQEAISVKKIDPVNSVIVSYTRGHLC
jgi:hypothetical protein